LAPRFEDQWRTRFEEFAELRDDDAGIAGWTTTGLDARVRRFLGLWKPGEAGTWLDAGCGAGTYIRLLLRHGHQVVGTDYSLPTLRKAVARGLDGVAFTVADVRRLPFGPEQFDGILCLGVTQALEATAPAVTELARLLKPGGQLWIDALNGWCLVHAFGALRRKVLGDAERLRYESPHRVKKLCRDAGLVDVRLHWMPIMPSRSYSLQRVIEASPVSVTMEYIPVLGALASHAFIVQATKQGRVSGPAVSSPSA
jgi:SAM-dependent methyltransferase